MKSRLVMENRPSSVTRWARIVIGSLLVVGVMLGATIPLKLDGASASPIEAAKMFGGVALYIFVLAMVARFVSIIIAELPHTLCWWQRPPS